MTKRKHISDRTKLAAALCAQLHEDENGKLVPIIPHEHAKAMHEDQIFSLWDWDHFPVAKAFGGPDAHWNLRPRLRKEHRQKTATVDMPAIAKSKRIEKKHAAFRARVLQKAEKSLEVRRAKSVVPGSKASPWKKHLNGKVSKRDKGANDNGNS